MAELSLEELFRVHRAAESFEAAWRQDRRPRLERYVPAGSKRLARAVLENLLGIELELRRKLGERPSFEEYARRFPEHRAIVAAVFRESGESPAG
jgi:hypothetical protein